MRSFNSGNAYLKEPRVSGNSNKSIQEWRLRIDNAIMTPTEMLPVLREVRGRLLDIWVVYKGFREALIDRINTFICASLYGSIKKLNNEKREEPKNKFIRNSRNNNKNKSRNSRKQYSCARCQELFQECPKS